MSADLVFSFMFSVFVLLGISVVYASFPQTTKVPAIVRKIIMGLLITGIGITLMGTSYTYTEGIFYDARSVVLSISGMFLGIIPTLIGIIGMTTTRIIMGGTGTLAGSLSIVTSGIIGLVWRYIRFTRSTKEEVTIAWFEFWLVGIVTSLVVILSQLVLPWDTVKEIIPKIVVPLLIIYPLGQLGISFVMITQRNQFFIRRRVGESEEQYRKLFIESEAMQFILEPEDGQILDINNKVLEVYGYSREELLQMHVSTLDLLPSDEVRNRIGLAMSEKQTIFSAIHQTKNLQQLVVEIHAGPIPYKNHTKILAMVFDRTQQATQEQQLQELDDKFRTMLLSIAEGIIVFDEFGEIALTNQKVRSLLSLSKNDGSKQIKDKLFRIYSKTTNQTIQETLEHVLLTNLPFRSDTSYILVTPDNNQVYIDFTVAPIILQNSDENHGAILVLRDITLEHLKNEEIRYISQHDHLTGLYNRYYFETELHKMDTKRQLPLSIIMGDVNGLKLLNDAFTHLEGDKLLQEIAKILKVSTRHEDVVCRWGGDEFAILLPQTTNEEAHNIIHRIKTKCDSSSYKVIKPSLSLGAATKETESQKLYDIIKTAEEHMYREKLQEAKSMRNSLIATLENTLYAKSTETKEHADNMIDLASKMGRKLLFTSDQINTITLIAKLHDIGKIAISDTILQKDGPLTDDEWIQIKRHPDVGSRLVQNIPELNHISEGILYHHERWDGSGYPEGLTGDTIPLFSRIISIVDAYEVMTNGRTYRPAISHEAAIKEIIRCKGSQFDPGLVDVFIELFR
jgi:diguanylate cyclase (GGDEF)-like protein/PAS domain S-box-containing protein